MQGGVMTNISSRQRSAISGRPLPEWRILDQKLDRPTYAPAIHTMAFSLQCLRQRLTRF